MNDFNLIKRTRAKTPVFAVGQLEGKLHTDQAKALGEQYRAVLPIRTLTPCVEQDDPPWPPRKLRKTKCQRNLRDLMKEHSRSSSYSDSETLVGSEPTTPLSATFKCGDIAKQNVNRSEARKMQYAIVPDSRLDTDPPAVKSSMDLLTNELVTALFRQHSPHHDRASSLQVLLMIEAYETAQQHLRHQMHDPHVTDHTEDQLESAERTLEHWLQVLCSVYDRSRENEVTEIVNKDDWPLPLSLKDDFSPPASWDGLTLDIGSQSSLEHLPRKGDGNFI